MRNMSFALTTEQYRDRSKTVTRRLGWANLKAGEQFMGVVKSQGLKRGEHPEKIHASECVSNYMETLNGISQADVIREGFPHMSPGQFVTMFCDHNGGTPMQTVNRIEFKHL